MQVLIYTDKPANEWRGMLDSQVHQVTTMPLGTPQLTSDFDICVLLNVSPADLVAHRAWMRSLTTPTLVITTALKQAEALCHTAPWLRLICPPNRAAYSFSALLFMTLEVRSGVVVLNAKLATGSLRRFVNATR